MKKVILTIALLTMAGSMVAMEEATAPKEETPVVTTAPSADTSLSQATQQEETPVSTVVAAPAKQPGKLMRLIKNPETKNIGLSLLVGGLTAKGSKQLGAENKNVLYVGLGAGAATYLMLEVKDLIAKKRAASATVATQEEK